MVMSAPPLGMLAELTHRCPLHCPYCSNPVELIARRDELTTGQWLDVLDAARDIGVLQVHMSGGEPLARPDLPALVVARDRPRAATSTWSPAASGSPRPGWTTWSTAASPTCSCRCRAPTPQRADLIAGTRAHDHKLAAAELIKAAGLPLDRERRAAQANHDQLAAIIALAERMGADRLELANTQYYGWALRNREALMPTPGAARRGRTDRACGDRATARHDADRVRGGRLLRDRTRSRACTAGARGS